MTDSGMRQVPIAVVGIGALFPGATTTDGFWRNVVDGKDLIEETPATHWLIEDYYDPDPSKPGKTYGKRGAFLSDIDFDPLDHAIPPNNLTATDTAQLLALIVAKRVLYDACRLDFTRIDPLRTSVILGVASATELAGSMAGSLQYPIWRDAMRAVGLSEAQAEDVITKAQTLYADWSESTFPGLLGNVVAGRIASRFGLGGTNCVIDAACASSLGAVQMAVQELSLGHSDLVITGGVDTLNDVFMFVCFSRTPALSPTGDCRPFSENADGTALGEGVGMLALRRLEDAERDGDRIYAVLRGVGSSSDGRAKSIYAPRPEGQMLALERAYRMAGYGPESVELVEAHGTATVAGDIAELTALIDVFSRSGRNDARWCAVGSVKSQIGHTKGAAGAASLIKTVLALHHKVLPPTIKVTAPNPLLCADGVPFYVNTALRPWVRGGGHPRRASVSSFGFGGSNFHITLEEYPVAPRRRGRIRHLSSELFLFSASHAEMLREALAAAGARATKQQEFATTARDTQRNFDHAQPLRLAIVAASAEDLRVAAARFQAGGSELSWSGPGVHFRVGETIKGPIVFLFPGQGSQYVDMGAELAMAFDGARRPWDDVADLDDAGLAMLPRIVFPPPAFTDDERRVQQNELTKTSNAQPAIALASLSYLDLLMSAGVKPDACAGHSFGELTALYAAGAMSREQFVRLSVLRGRLMDEASRASEGGMLAVFASREIVMSAGGVAEGRVTIANHNTPKQVVVAGSIDEIENVAKEFADRGVETRRIPVGAAFHSQHVADSAAPFRTALASQKFKAPVVPVFANATASPYPSAPGAVAELLSKQIVQEVHFVELIEAMHADGARIFIEVGPNAILSEFVGRCLEARPHLSLALDGRLHDGVWRFWNALGRLAVEGVPLELAPFWEGFDLETPDLEPKSPASVAINGSNFGKRYPAKRMAPAAAPSAATLQAHQEPPSVTRPKFSSAKAAPAVEAPPPSTMAAPAPAPPPRATPVTAPDSREDDRRRSLLEIVRHSSEAHQVAQQALVSAHMAYLKTTEAALRLAAGAGVDIIPPVQMNVAPPQVTQPIPAPAPDLGVAPPPMTPPPAPPPAHRAMVVDPRAAAPLASTARDITALLLDIVAAKTGYPISMLTPDMELERDLGVDSIKRVEILAAARQAAPELSAVDPNELASLTTLRAIGERLGVAAPGAPIVASSVDPPPAQQDIAALLLGIVAEKTGYPVAMLKPEMDLERDLGVDSIKRVEIFAAARKAIPDLPQIDTNEFAQLTTLASIGAKLSAARPDPSPETHGSAPRIGGLRRLILRTEEARRPSATRRPQCVAVQDSAKAQAVVEALTRRGIRTERFSDTPGQDADAVMLFALDDAAPGITGARAMEATRAFARRSGEAGALLMSVQDTGGDFGVSGRCGASAWLAELPGLVKTAAREWPQLRAKAIDIEYAGRTPEMIGETLVDELLCVDDNIETGLPATGQRLKILTVERALPDAPATDALPNNAVLVVTGARGVTAACVRALALQRQVRLAFLGRTELLDTSPELASLDEMGLRAALATRDGELTPDLRRIGVEARRIFASNETRRTLCDLERLGVECLYRSVDVSNGARLREVLDDVRSRWGRIDGLVHGAGVLADGRIETVTRDRFDAVFTPKVLGLRALLDATAQDELRLIVLFSSLAGRLGKLGQSAYAMANEVLNKVARAEAARRGPDCLVRALNWGPLAGGMVTPELQRHFAERGVMAISLKEGAEAFVCEILRASRDPAEVEVMLCDASSDSNSLD